MSGVPARKVGSARVVKIPLVWYSLTHDTRQTALGVLGVAFSAILMFMQLGFLGAVRNTATTILDKLDFDIMLASPTYLYFYDTGSFPRIRLEQARSVSGVKGAVPLQVGFNTWSRPGGGESASLGSGSGTEDLPVSLRAIFVLGYNLADQPFRRDAVPGLKMRVLSGADGAGCRSVGGPEDLNVLKRPDTILFDRDSHPDFGAIELLDPCHESAGQRPPSSGLASRPARAIVGQREVEVVGSFDLAIGFGADGALLVGDENFSRLFGGRSMNEVSIGLIRTTSDPEHVATALERILPSEDVRVFTRAEILEQETRYWIREKPIGIIFGLGIVVACAVGVVFVYQILSSDITKRFSEFATLKAMGYPDRVVSGLVIKQALVLCHAGFFPGLIVAAILDKLVSLATRMPIELTLSDAIGVYIASTLICMISALLSVGKVRRADPAELFA
ncbi:FtsX-like permease family protein [Singulisphaera sp. Ch08]|uniref:FtsX-like permease family protein n=1 Tax=Singulisphaera sp. Ch08 TaxID=3120278 RepID=A0AAU7CNS8_9BACT